jgi:predicted permease
MTTLIQDLRYACRQLAKSPGFTIVALLSLALGTGANIAVFQFIDAILLSPLQVAEPGRLVSLYQKASTGMLSSSSYRDFEFYRDHNHVFSGMLAYLRVPMMLRDGELPEAVTGELVSVDYFSVLGLPPALGRGFRDEEGREPGAHPVAVISHDYWQRHFAADRDVLGRGIRIAARTFTIVGVAPRGFRGLALDWGKAPEVWVPAAMYREAVPAMAKVDVLGSWGMQSFLVVGRLRPGVSIEQARAAMRVLSDQVAPLRTAFQEEHWKFEAVLYPGQQGRIWPERRATVVRFFTALAVVAGVVLLVACLNLANLLLARYAARDAEFAVRASLGAGAGRLMRQLLTESMLLSLLGGAGGLVVAHGIVGCLTGFERAFFIPLSIGTEMNASVFGCALLVTLAAGLLFGWLPAYRASHQNLSANLKSRTVSAGPGRRGIRLRDVLVAAQIACSLAVLVVTGLCLRTLRNAEAADATLAPDRVLLADLNLATQGYDQERATRFYPLALERVRALAGVETAALVWTVPLSGVRGGTDITVDSAAGADPPVQVDYNVISPDYFRTVGVPVARGREFTLADRAGGEQVAVINDRMARRFWNGEDALGKRFRLASTGGRDVIVVGVVKDTHYRSVREQVNACFYLPLSQSPRLEMHLEIRSSVAPSMLAPGVRAILRSLDPSLAAPVILTLESHRNQALAQERLAALLLSGLGVLALGLVAIGLYGVVSFAAGRRTREIGIRVALGASSGGVLGLVLRRELVVVAAGIVAGFGLASASTRLIASMLYGVSPLDIATFAGVSALLGAVTLLACYVPARRASDVDPVVALRCE